MRTLRWYFDFVSPFSYLQTQRFDALPDDVTIEYCPVLFAGLLKHWGTIGPAELAPKRRFTYRYVEWYARHHAIKFRTPPAHPFNPLPALRLAFALQREPAAVHTIFDFIWGEGNDIDDDAQWERLIERLDAGDAHAALGTPAIKDALRRSGDEAIERGVFGVPTFIVDAHLFWGLDATDMVIDYLAAPARFDDAEMKRLDGLPVGASR